MRPTRLLCGNTRRFHSVYARTNLLSAEVDLNLLPSPPWGRGWTATGVFISRGGTGEGVKAVAYHPNSTRSVRSCEKTAEEKSISREGARKPAR